MRCVGGCSFGGLLALLCRWYVWHVVHRVRCVRFVFWWVAQAGALWAYSTVFASSFSANVPVFFLSGGGTCNMDSDEDCSAHYRVWLAVFSLFVVPLSCMDLREQQALQVTMAAGRFLVIAVLVGTVLAGFECDGTAFTGYTDQSSFLTYAKLSGLKIVVPVAVYAQVPCMSVAACVCAWLCVCVCVADAVINCSCSMPPSQSLPSPFATSQSCP